jgi:hypothetical protein
MPDNIVFTFFIILSILSLALGTLAGYFSYKNSQKMADEMWMIFWGIIALACLVFGGLIWAWFLIPIILNHLLTPFFKNLFIIDCSYRYFTP